MDFFCLNLDGWDCIGFIGSFRLDRIKAALNQINPFNSNELDGRTPWRRQVQIQTNVMFNVPIGCHPDSGMLFALQIPILSNLKSGKMKKIQKIACLILIPVFSICSILPASAQGKREETGARKAPEQQPRPQQTPRPEVNQQPRPQQTPRPEVNQQPRPQQTPRPQVNQQPQQQPVTQQTTINRDDAARREQNRSGNNRNGYRPQGWANTRPAYTRPPVVYNNRRYYTYHNYYSHPYRPYNYGPRWHPYGYYYPGAFSGITINFGNSAYQYNDGVFYQPYNSGYRVVYAPYGAYVPSLPPGFEEAEVGGQLYYYYGGTFYILNGRQYEVVNAPAGAIISHIPEGANTVLVANYSYLEYNGTYYQPVYINGRDAYEVVEFESEPLGF